MRLNEFKQKYQITKQRKIFIDKLKKQQKINYVNRREFLHHVKVSQVMIDNYQYKLLNNANEWTKLLLIIFFFRDFRRRYREQEAKVMRLRFTMLKV